MALVEQWRTVSDYPDYEVSDAGRVRKGARIMATPPQSNGYPHLGLRRDGVTKTFTLHSLVADAFLPNRPPGHVVNHINADKSDCRSANLEYVTPHGNALHAASLSLFPKGDRHWSRRDPEKMRRAVNLRVERMKRAAS